MTGHQQSARGNISNQTTAVARFDQDGCLVDANGEFSDLKSVKSGSAMLPRVLGEYLEQFETINQSEFDGAEDAGHKVIDKWSRHDGAALEARSLDGELRLLSSCPDPGGGALYFSIRIDQQKHLRDLIQIMVENLPLPMWINQVDNGEVLYANPAANNIYGLGTGSRDSRNITEFFLNRDDSTEMLNTLRAKGIMENYPVKTKTASGHELWVTGCARISEFQGKEVASAVIQDLTDRRGIEEDTLKARDMLRDAIESLSEGFALYDEDSRLVMFNNSYREMNHAVADILEPGLDWEILMRETARRGVYAEAVGREDAWVSDRIESGVEYTQDYELQHTDGTHYLVSVHPTKLGGFVVTRTDITAKKQAEIAERDGDLLIRQVLEASPAAVVMARVGDGEILYRSPAAAELFGKVKNAREFFKTIDDRADYITRLLADGQVDDFKLTLINAQGDEFPAAAYGRIAEFKGEEVAVTTTIDLTRQNEAQALIRQVLEACPVPVQMTNAETGELLFRSPETTALFGAVDISTAYYVDPNARGEYLEKLREKGWINEHKAQFKNARGGHFWGAVSARLIKFNGQQVIVSNTRDLTEELAIQEELSSQREMLFQNEKMSALGELLAGVAHELNNPLSIVVGHSLMLREEARDPETVKRIGKISNAAERCAKIVKTFLAMARQQPSKMENTDINSIIATAVDVAGYGSKGEAFDIQCDLAENVPEIVADSDQITQVIINLIINAEQAMVGSGQGDRISVTTGIGKSGEYVEIFVTDNGPGIPENIRARIFEPFFTTKDIGDGTGIGLAFCHRIIHSHGGQIWADSDYRDGGRFGIALPRSSKPVEDDDAESDALSRNRSNVRALVVDDEVDVAELIAEILKKEGFRVDLAHSGLQAVERLKNHRYDLLLSDLNMPELDGRGLYEVIRDDFPDLLERTAFITGDTMGFASQGLLRESKRPYLEKPVSPAELRELVYRLLNPKEDIN
jgi:PAS domain S-box-containing protein